MDYTDKSADLAKKKKRTAVHQGEPAPAPVEEEAVKEPREQPKAKPAKEQKPAEEEEKPKPK